jgi:hypothetical protein
VVIYFAFDPERLFVAGLEFLRDCGRDADIGPSGLFSLFGKLQYGCSELY